MFLLNLFRGFLAQSFASPALLWGLALGAAPVIIHLLNKRKYRETSWAAMRFLLEAVRKNSRRMRIEHLILLAVRTLILMLLVMALAEPVGRRLGAFFQPRQPTHRIIVIDASLSMGLAAREETLFARAKDAARAIVEQGRPGDVFNLVRLSNIPPAVIVADGAYVPGRMIEEIEQMPLPHGVGDVAACLAKIEELLKLAPEVPRKEVVIISDFQRTTWAAGPAEDVSRVRALLKRFDEAGNLVLVDLGQTDAANVAVTSLEALDTFVTTARPAAFRASVRNYGPERVTGRVLEILVDDRPVDQRAVDLNPGGEKVEDFSIPFSQGGEHRVLVRVQKDALPLDDQRWLAVPVKDRIRVLCVNGGSSQSAAGSATEFLELALAPAGVGPAPAPGLPRRGLIEPTVISEGELQGFDLAAYDCVFLCNVRLFTDREAQTLETYLTAGGGVVWCLGDQVSLENYNQILYRQGTGSLPAKLVDRVGDADKRESVYAFDPGDFSHPLVSAFQGNPDAGLESTQAYVYVKATLPPQGASRTALAFDTGDPAIVERPFGRGRSLLVTTSVDDLWGPWPLWPSFLPLVHEIVEFAVSGRWGERQRLVGEPLTEIFPATAVDADVAVGRPDGETQVARVVPQDAFNQLVYENTNEAGVYEINFAQPVARSELFVVNVDPRESNLAKFAQEEITEELLPGTGFTYLTAWPDEETAPPETSAAHQGGLTRWLLYVVLYLMFTEQMLAWDFRKGLWLLCPFVPLCHRLLGRVRAGPKPAG
ncbi:MAG: BatA domain-containing protein [Deltaproteobacteria bacterium]